ncbi:hypothetical protein OUZ56_023253 [Daphnia magna]|uniref:Uncharacterized protein n=1 Tax=Daphnia magna TaxID=35525 RepID=A0ABR0AYQ9_9CRUS|nr:hypothetical protein OUZ56_023253 [Daphnia magna]
MELTSAIREIKPIELNFEKKNISNAVDRYISIKISIDSVSNGIITKDASVIDKKIQLYMYQAPPILYERSIV